MLCAASLLTAAAMAWCFLRSTSRWCKPTHGERDLYFASLDRDRRVHRCRCDAPLRLALCGYDPASQSLSSLRRFERIKRGTQCVFARLAILWGCRDCDPETPLRERVMRSLQAFCLFASLHDGVDGFLFEATEARSLSDLCGALRTILGTLSQHDPSGYCCVRKALAFKRGWVFTFNGAELFVTTFAPCYGSNSSRYSFGERNSAFVLLQPYHSFLLHDVGSDTPATSWDRPQTVRDRIRVAFRNVGRPYPIPARPESYPAANNFVLPLESMDGDVVRWWEAEGDEEEDASVKCSEANAPGSAATTRESGLEHLYD